MNIYSATTSSSNVRLIFPSLDDSPLWAENFRLPGEPPKQESSPPLFIIRDHYPRVAAAIELMWGTPEMEAYFSRLIVNDRGNRAGFLRPVMAAILTLSADHAKRFKFNQPKHQADHWGSDRFHRHAFK